MDVVRHRCCALASQGRDPGDRRSTMLQRSSGCAVAERDAPGYHRQSPPGFHRSRRRSQRNLRHRPRTDHLPRTHRLAKHGIRLPASLSQSVVENLDLVSIPGRSGHRGKSQRVQIAPSTDRAESGNSPGPSGISTIFDTHRRLSRRSGTNVFPDQDGCRASDWLDPRAVHHQMHRPSPRASSDPERANRSMRKGT